MAQKKNPSIASQQAQRDKLRSELRELTHGVQSTAEALDHVRAMLGREDRNFRMLVGHSADGGLTLDNLKEWSNKIRNSVVGAPWIKRGLGLRATYIWQDGIRYGHLSKRVETLTQESLNLRNFFGPTARRKREGSLYHDGLAIYIGDNASKQLRALPLEELTDVLRDPDYHADIWAYQRTWMQESLTGGQPVRRVEWYFTDTFYDKRVPTITRGNDQQPVSQTHTAFDMHANSMEGYAFGSPDALAAQIWNGIVRDAYMDGVTMTRAMASYAYKATHNTKDAGARAALAIGGSNEPGQTALTGSASDLVPMASAGKGYDFETLRGLTAVVAASLDVSNIALTADPGAAGSSYGSASTLDLPTRLAMQFRRSEHEQFDIRVLKWMGAPKATAEFDSLVDPNDLFREVQALLLLWSSGLYEPKPLEARLSILMQVIGNTVPSEILIPNNADSLARSDIDADASGVGEPNETPAGQGKASKVGKGAGSNDLRNDGVSEMLARIEAFMAAFPHPQ